MLFASRFDEDLQQHAQAFVTYYIENNYQDVSDDLYYWVTNAVMELSHQNLIEWLHFHHHHLGSHTSMESATPTPELVNWNKLRHAVASYVTTSLMELIVEELTVCGDELTYAAKQLAASTVITATTLNES